MAKKGRSPVTIQDVRIVAHELRQLAIACDTAVSTMEKLGVEVVVIEGLPTVQVAMRRIRTFASSAIGNAHLPSHATDPVEEAIAEDVEKLKAHRTKAKEKKDNGG